MDNTANQAFICGTLAELPQFSHENHGMEFYRFLVEVPRLSGTTDVIPVVASYAVLEQLDLSGGENLAIQGQIRSFNTRGCAGRHLLIFLYAGSIQAVTGPPANEVLLTGTLCKVPVYRRTPLGREICDGMLAVPRTYHRADYLPCIFWGRTAYEISHFPAGTEISVCGRIQSRTYVKASADGPVNRTAYEISALSAKAPILELTRP